MKNKLTLDLIYRIFVITVIYLIIYAFMSVQITITFDNAQFEDLVNYIEKNPKETVSNLLNYSYTKGMIIEKKVNDINVNDKNGNSINLGLVQDVDPYAIKIEELEKRYYQNELILSYNDYLEYSISVNPNIKIEVSRILYRFSIYMFLLFMAIMLIIYAYMNKRIFKPINNIIDYIDDIKKLKENPRIPELEYDDEIKIISKHLEELEEEVKLEIQTRDEILRAISHELKTPLAQISSILFLYENKTEKYTDFSYTKEQIDEIVDNNNKLITSILKSLNVETKMKKEVIDLKEMIDEKIKYYDSLLGDIYLEVNIDTLIVEKNPIAIDMIISNIISNMVRYSETYLIIEQKDNSLIFENDYTKEISIGTGDKIIKTMCKIEKVKLTKKVDKNNYLVKLEFHDK